jgi:hypothetical protein
MQNKLAIVGGTAAVLLMGITGCFSQQRTADAQGGGGHLANVSATTSTQVSTSWSGTRQETVKDPGDGATAFTVSVPTGWKYVGTILRPKGCHGPATAADGLSYTVMSPDNVTAEGQMPGAGWFWASDGTSPLGKNCSPIAINSANAFLLNIAIPNAHPNATNIKVGMLSPDEKHAIESYGQGGPSYGMNMRRSMDIGRVTLEFNERGRVIDEQMSVVLTCQESDFPAYPQMHRAARSQRMCTTHGTWFKRAPQGHLDELLAHKLQGAQINHEWDQEISRKMQQGFDAYVVASDHQFAEIQKHYADVTAGMLQRGRDFQQQQQISTDHAMQADRDRQAATDHAAQLQMRDSLNRQDFVDPNTGRRIETSNQYTHNWIGSDGTVVLNRDPTFDPNGTVDPVRESFTELIPVD